MNIYISHSTSFDFKKELYEPIRKSELAKVHTFILPHDSSDEQFNTKELFSARNCDLVIAEVSYPSTGQGIELGWANVYDIPVACVHKKDAHVSGSLQAVSNRFLSHTNTKDLLGDIATIIKAYES